VPSAAVNSSAVRGSLIACLLGVVAKVCDRSLSVS
jgi:hypothetical protein